MIQINHKLALDENEVEFQPIRAQGAGGQNVNKVSTAVHLRFDIARSSLPDDDKARLLAYPDQRISADGIIVIKAQEHRSQIKNRQDALERLAELIRNATRMQKKRRATRPTKASKERRLKHKTSRGQVKSLRKKVDI